MNWNFRKRIINDNLKFLLMCCFFKKKSKRDNFLVCCNRKRYVGCYCCIVSYINIYCVKTISTVTNVKQKHWGTLCFILVFCARPSTSNRWSWFWWHSASRRSLSYIFRKSFLCMLCSLFILLNIYCIIIYLFGYYVFSWRSIVFKNFVLT